MSPGGVRGEALRVVNTNHFGLAPVCPSPFLHLKGEGRGVSGSKPPGVRSLDWRPFVRVQGACPLVGCGAKPCGGCGVVADVAEWAHGGGNAPS